jgi:hypothetical protein
MEDVQSRSSRATSLADTPVFSKIKSWFEGKNETEPTA